MLASDGFSALLSRCLLLLIGAYRTAGTTHIGGSCRFHPSCSEYAQVAATKYNPLFATKLILRRLLRCRPFGPFGFDPVPENTSKRVSTKTKEK